MRSTPAVLALMAAVLGGCASTQRHQVVIALDEASSRAATRPTINVDIVGVSDAERRTWDQMPLSSYWLPGSELRSSFRDRAVSVRFSPEQSQLFVVPAESEMWSTWRKAGATWLYVVANLPGGMADRPGGEDPRRLVISLDPSRWEDGTVFEIKVRRDGVILTTPARGSSGADPSR